MTYKGGKFGHERADGKRKTNLEGNFFLDDRKWKKDPKRGLIRDETLIKWRGKEGRILYRMRETA